MAFQKGNKLGKAAKKAAEPKKEVKAAAKNKAEEVKDSDVLAAVNQEKLAAAQGVKKEAQPVEKEYIPASKSYYTVWNMSVNPLLLRIGKHEIEIISRECKKVDADIFEELLKLQYIRNLLDKGLLRATKQVDKDEPLSKDISVQKAPEYLTENVSRTDGFMTIAAEVKKDAGGKAFKPAGSIDINLG